VPRASRSSCSWIRSRRLQPLYYDLQIRNEIARAQREQSSLALLIADIDDFKSFNTSFGYEAGNQVLVQVAAALRAGVRPFDTVARWGGEEFAVLLRRRSSRTTCSRSPNVSAPRSRARRFRLEGLEAGARTA
jgi:diguanylate cyclase (GGDEF)-like protein